MQERHPSSLPPVAQLAQPVLHYATADQLTASRATVIATRALAVAQLLLGAAGLAFAGAIVASGDGPWFFGLPVIACAVAHGAIGILMFRPNPTNWKAARLMLGLLVVLALGFIAFGTVLFLMYHETSGWDQLAAVIGVVMVAIATAPFALNLLTLWYLMRPYPRALFGVSVTRSFFGRKSFMRTMAALWVIAIAAGLIAWLT